MIQVEGLTDRVAVVTGAGRGIGQRIAETLAVLHPGLAIVIASDAPRVRSENGFRLVDRWRTAERIVDEMELAHIGIPAFVTDPLRVLSMLEPVHAS